MRRDMNTKQFIMKIFSPFIWIPVILRIYHINQLINVHNLKERVLSVAKMGLCRRNKRIYAIIKEISKYKIFELVYLKYRNHKVK